MAVLLPKDCMDCIIRFCDMDTRIALNKAGMHCIGKLPQVVMKNAEAMIKQIPKIQWTRNVLANCFYVRIPISQTNKHYERAVSVDEGEMIEVVVLASRNMQRVFSVDRIVCL